MKLFKGMAGVLWLMTGSMLVLSFSGFTQTAPDDLGQVSQSLVDFLLKWMEPGQAQALYAALAVLTLTGIQSLLKEMMKKWVKTKYGKYGKYVYPLLLRILSQKWLLGKGILRYNAEFDPSLSPEDKEDVAAQIKEEIRKEIIKKYPMFQIEIGNIKK